MGRKTNWPPAPKVHSSGQWRVCYKGEIYYLGPAGSEAARRAYAELLKRLSPPESARGLTVAGCARLWLAHAEARYAGSHEAYEHGLAMAPVTELFGALPAASFGCPQLEEARDAMVAAGLCRNVVNRRVVRVRTAWRWLERRGHAPPGSWSALRALEPLTAADRHVRSTPPVGPAPWAAVEAALPKLARPARPLLLLLWHTGARPSELFSLEAKHIDRAGDVWLYRPQKHKCAWRGHQRLVAFGPEAQAVLAPAVEARPSGLLFPNSRGGPYAARTFALEVRRAAARARVRLNPYQLRHAFASRAADAAGLEGARAALGHRTASMTLHYSKGGDEERAKDAARKAG